MLDRVLFVDFDVTIKNCIHSALVRLAEQIRVLYLCRLVDDWDELIAWCAPLLVVALFKPVVVE